MFGQSPQLSHQKQSGLSEESQPAPGPVSRRRLLGAAGIAGAVAATFALPASANAQPASGAPAWIDVTEQGLAGDGTTDDTAALTAILQGVADAATLYFPPGAYRFAGDVHVPANVTLILDRGAVLEPDTGATLTLDGSVQAGAYRIVGGAGVTIGTFGARLVTPQWFGASPVSEDKQDAALADPNHDDAQSIRAAVEALYQAGGGTVYLTPGVYVLRSVVGDNNSLILPRSNVSILGAGDDSVLKVANGLSGLYRSFNVIFSEGKGAAYRVDNASFSDFKVDGNGVANLQPDVTGTKNKCAAIGIQMGSNIAVDHVTVVQNAGRQCFLFGANQKPAPVADVRLTNCYVNTVGSTVTGNVYQNDHSVVYAVVDGFVMQGNIFVQPVKESQCTAIELHSSRTVVTGNIVNNFDKAFNLASIVADMRGVVIANNNFRGLNCAIFVYSAAGLVMQDVQVSDNLFEQTGLGGYYGRPYGFIEGSVDAKAAVEDMSFVGNSFTCLVDAGADRMPGLRVGPIKRLVARGNTFKGFTGPAVTLDAILDNESALVIERNDVIDCGRTTNEADRVGLNLASPLKIKSLIVRDNVLVRADPAAMETGISGTSLIGAGTVTGNLYENIPTELSWAETADNGNVIIEHLGSGNPNDDRIPASFGSTWINPTTEDVWDKRRNGNSADGWVRQR
jgi:hypothetical protein